MNRFSQVAKATTTVSRVMENRTKVGIEDIIRNYPQGVTITEFDFITSNGSTFPVLAIKEDPQVCFFGGYILDKMCKAWVGDGDIDETSEELKASGGVKVKLTQGKTKTGRTITNVEVLED